MGLAKDLRGMARDYKKDPHKQFYKHLDSLLDIGQSQGISKNQILSHVKDYLHGK